MFPYISLTNKITLPLYGPIFLIGFFVAVCIARKLAPEFKISKVDITYGSIYGVIGVLIGSKLLYFITKIPNIVMNINIYLKLLKMSPANAISYAFGGLVFYGGLIGAFFGVYLYCKKYKVSFGGFLDVYAPLIPFVHGFGRIGCFLSGCCYGIEYHGFGCVYFPYNELIPQLSQVPRVPVQLIEAGLNFFMFVILLFLLRRKKTRPGQLMGIYILYYAVCRYFLEMLRGDILRGKIGMFSTSQIISIILIPIGIVLVRGKWIQKHIDKNN